MVHELDAEHVVGFAFLEVGDFPDVADSVDISVVAVGGNHLHRDHLPVAACGREIIDHSEAILPVHADKRGQHVEMKLVAEGESHIMPVFLGHVHKKRVAFLESRGRIYLLNLFFNIAHFR